MKSSTITVLVDTDEKNFTKSIRWNAPEGGIVELKNANAMLLGFWDADENAGMNLDLWTDKMPVDDMKIFIHHSLLRLSELARVATADQESGKLINEFAHRYADKNDLINPEKRK